MSTRTDGFRALAACEAQRDDARRRVRALESVLADRERELLEAKGPCSNKTCPLHYAHSGPCDTREAS